jgi:hypothetical protein
MSNIMKIRPVKTELFHVDGRTQTDRRSQLSLPTTLLKTGFKFHKRTQTYFLPTHLIKVVLMQFAAAAKGRLHPIDIHVQGDQKVSVHLMITIQKVTSNVQTVACYSTDIY